MQSDVGGTPDKRRVCKRSVGEVFKLGHIAENDSGVALFKPGKNAFFNPLAVSELDEDRKAVKLLNQVCKVDAVVVCVMKALRKLKENCRKAVLLVQGHERGFKIFCDTLPG